MANNVVWMVISAGTNINFVKTHKTCVCKNFGCLSFHSQLFMSRNFLISTDTVVMVFFGGYFNSLKLLITHENAKVNPS